MYVARLGYRLQPDRTEFMGTILYAASDYVVNAREPIVIQPDKICPNPLTPAPFKDCESEGCEACEPECTDTVAINLSQCPTAKFLYDGETKQGAIRIKLDGTPCLAGTVDYAFADVTAIYDTNYTSSLGQTGTIEIPKDCNDDILIPVDILLVEPDADPLMINKISATLTLSNATGGVELGECVSTALCMIDNAQVCETEDCVPILAGNDCPPAEVVVPVTP